MTDAQNGAGAGSGSGSGEGVGGKPGADDQGGGGARRPSERAREALKRGQAVARARQAEREAELAAAAAAAEAAEAERNTEEPDTTVKSERRAEPDATGGTKAAGAAAAGTAGVAGRPSYSGVELARRAIRRMPESGQPGHGPGAGDAPEDAEPGEGQEAGRAADAGRRSAAAERARQAIKRPGEAVQREEGQDTGAESANRRAEETVDAEVHHLGPKRARRAARRARQALARAERDRGGAAESGRADPEQDRDSEVPGRDDEAQDRDSKGQVRDSERKDSEGLEHAHGGAEPAGGGAGWNAGQDAGRSEAEAERRPRRMWPVPPAGPDTAADALRASDEERAADNVAEVAGATGAAGTAPERGRPEQTPPHRPTTDAAGRVGYPPHPESARRSRPETRPAAPGAGRPRKESVHPGADRVRVFPPGELPSREARESTPSATAPPSAKAPHSATAPQSMASVESAVTWWGRAWLGALESAALDPARLARGEVYAREGHVGTITVAPGRISAAVRGSRPSPYRAELRVQPFSDAEWAAFLEGVADRPAHLAALLSRTVPRALAEQRGEHGVDLLPGPGELVPRCSCPDRGHPCKHAAALCFQAARLLDADPFVLLLLRGRGERELLDDLARRNASHTVREARVELPSVPARVALRTQSLPPLPPPLPVPDHAGRPPVLPTADDPAIDPAAVELLAADAAARARACLAAVAPVRTGGRREAVDESGLLPAESALSALFPAGTDWEDAIRLAARAHPTSGLTAGSRDLYRSLATAMDRSVSDVARAVAAWRQGGPEGLTLLEAAWDPPAGDFDRARSALRDADLPVLRPWRNRLTDSGRGIQLRFGHDGRWYPYESDPGTDDWWPTGRAEVDPVGALTPLLETE